MQRDHDVSAAHGDRATRSLNIGVPQRSHHRVMQRRRDVVTVLAGDLVIESPGGSAMATPHHAVVRRFGDTITS